jgi:serine/threonine protein kinase
MLDAGARFGSYEVVSLLGAGGMGEVYRARDTKLHRDVALKVLPDVLLDNPDHLAGSNARHGSLLPSIIQTSRRLVRLTFNAGPDPIDMPAMPRYARSVYAAWLASTKGMISFKRSP